MQCYAQISFQITCSPLLFSIFFFVIFDDNKWRVKFSNLSYYVVIIGIFNDLHAFEVQKQKIDWIKNALKINRYILFYSY